MVRYDGASETAPSPLNSRSGNRRSELGGRSHGGNIVMMRCTTRSERSEVSLKNGSSPDEVGAEVEAMGEVARVLAALPDAQSRARVLRWAMDRYRVEATPMAAPTVPVTMAAPAVPATMAIAGADRSGADLSLEVDSLHDLFPARPPADIDEAALSLAEPSRPAQESGIESMIRGFVADFQRFALEWQGT
jgi:hypothetical protein